MSFDKQDVKKRLQNLKNLSNTLKQKTEQSSTVDYSLIEKILFTAKANAKQNNTNKSSIQKEQQHINSNIFANLLGVAQANQGSLAKKDSDYLPTFPMNEKANNGFTHLLTDKNRKQYSSISRLPSGKIQSDPQQIIQNLQKQKKELEQQLLSLKSQIKQLQKQAQHNKEQSWKQGIPFFSLDQDINIFITKLNVSEKDYDKIDYAFTRVILDIDNISILKKGKDSFKKIDVNQLRQVFYLGDKNMVLYFKAINDVQEKLFLSFQNTEDLHRWDLGIFINFKIAQSLQKDRLFDGDLQFGYEKAEQQFSLQKNQEKQKLKFDQERAQIMTYSQQKEQIQEAQSIISKSLRESQRNQKSGEKQKSISLQKANSLRQKSRKQSSNKSDKGQQRQYKYKRGQVDGDVKQTRRFQEKGQQRNLEPIQQKTQRQDTSQFAKLLQKNKKESNKIAEDRLSPPPNLMKQASDNDKDYQLLKAKENLKHGYNLTKYAEGGWSPRQKKVYLSLDEQNIVFQDIQKPKNVKRHPLSEIKSIKYRQIGPGIKKHIQKHKIIVDRFVTIVINPEKRIQLGHSNILFISQFVNDLILVSQHNEGLIKWY